MALEPNNGTIFLTAHDFQSPGTGGGLFSYDIGSAILTNLLDSPNTGYWDIEIDLFDQRIYWTDYANGSILSAEFDGSDVTTELSGLTNPYGLALEFGPIPEPSTFILFIVGIFGTALYTYRRRTRTA
jgi:hypothetical protein